MLPGTLSESTSPTAHSIRCVDPVASLAARMAFGFRSMPVSETATPRFCAHPSIRRSISPSPQPTSTTRNGPADAPRTATQILQPRNRRPKRKRKPVHPRNVTQTRAQFLIAARLIHQSRLDAHVAKNQFQQKTTALPPLQKDEDKSGISGDGIGCRRDGSREAKWTAPV